MRVATALGSLDEECMHLVHTFVPEQACDKIGSVKLRGHTK